MYLIQRLILQIALIVNIMYESRINSREIELETGNGIKNCDLGMPVTEYNFSRKLREGIVRNFSKKYRFIQINNFLQLLVKKYIYKQ